MAGAVAGAVMDGVVVAAGVVMAMAGVGVGASKNVWYVCE